MAFAIKRLKTLHALLGIVFMISGLICNAIQLILFWIVKPRNIQLFRKLNYYLTYTVWCQVVALAEYWSGSTCSLYAESPDDFNRFGREHCLCIMNHKFEIDWINAWMMTDKFRCLASSKSITKKSLKYVPIVGWGWFFNEFIFLNRNLEKDRELILKGVDRLMDYEDPIILLLFCEGTRFTAEKHEASMKVAVEKGLAPLKHHLLPRTKGFALCLQRMKELDPESALYNIQIGFAESDDKAKQPTLSNMVKGRPIHADMYFERIPFSAIPTDTEEDINKFLFDLYQKKDKLMDFYHEHGKFPGKVYNFPRRLTPFVNWLLWFMPISVLVLSTLWYLLTSDNMYLVSLGVSFLTIGCAMIYIFIRLTKSSKGSSYGKSDSKTGTSSSSANSSRHASGDERGETARKRNAPNGSSS